MADQPQAERKVSLTLTIRINSITQSEAQALEDKIRDLADDFGAEVLSSRGAERPTFTRP